MVGHKNVKVVRKVELYEEFPGDSQVLVRMGRKMEEGSVSSAEDVAKSKSFSKTSSSVVTLV